MNWTPSMPKSSKVVLISFPTITSQPFRLSPTHGCYRPKRRDRILKNNFIFFGTVIFLMFFDSRRLPSRPSERVFWSHGFSYGRRSCHVPIYVKATLNIFSDFLPQTHSIYIYTFRRSFGYTGCDGQTDTFNFIKYPNK